MPALTGHVGPCGPTASSPEHTATGLGRSCRRRVRRRSPPWPGGGAGRPTVPRRRAPSAGRSGGRNRHGRAGAVDRVAGPTGVRADAPGVAVAVGGGEHVAGDLDVAAATDDRAVAIAVPRDQVVLD